MAGGLKVKICEFCQKEESTKNFRRHLQRNHPDKIVKRQIKEEQFRCEQHGLVVRSKLRRHYDTLHSGESPPSFMIPEHNEQTQVRCGPVPAKADKDRVERHQIYTKAAIQKTFDQIQEQLLDNPFGESSRLGQELPEYLREIQRHVPVKPLTFREYVSMLDTRDDVEANFRYEYVVCSSIQAHRILKIGCPKVPIVVPRSDSSKPTMTIDEYVIYLSTTPRIDVHTYSQIVDDEGEYLKPLPLSAVKAIELFRDKAAGPVNFLDLGIHKQNEVPSCLVDLPAYRILRDVQGYKPSNETTGYHAPDLSSGVAFQVLGKNGVQSLSHVDQHHVMTTVRIEEGEKAWSMSPVLTQEEMDRFATSDDIAPRPPPFIICLRAGDLLIQPPGRVHSPYSITDVLMTGTMHWDSRQLAEIMRHTLYTRENPKITNEDPANDITSKLEIIESLWKQKHSAWPWGSDEHLTEFSKLLKV
jgi:hypothetical protein